MKTLLCYYAISTVAAQLPSWTWLSGSSLDSQPGDYSVQGTPSPEIYPAARLNHGGAIHPLTNDFVVFGGYLRFNNWVNDLWSYSFTSNMWTWISGTNAINQLGVYGTKGVASSSNHPGSRNSFGMDIHPFSGLLVLFGGQGFDSTSSLYLNDLWTFDFNTSMWTWVSGGNQGIQQSVYGTKGVASATNVPGGRCTHSIKIHPHTGNVIVFGGQGYPASTTSGILNDLWSFNMTSNLWTWISGATTSNQAGVYGSKGVASGSNIIGARYCYSITFDTHSGNMFIFGGWTTASSNDLWSYNFTSGMWTWLSGSASAYQSGVYGTKGIASPSNVPGHRYCHSMATVPNLKALLIFGSSIFPDHYNDFWQYNLTSNMWTWIGGSNTGNQRGIYGTKGISNISNVAGARYSASLDCFASSEKCVLFGGSGYGSSSSSAAPLNDLWIIDFPSNRAITLQQSSMALKSTHIMTEYPSHAFTTTSIQITSSISDSVSYGDHSSSLGEDMTSESPFSELAIISTSVSDANVPVLLSSTSTSSSTTLTRRSTTSSPRNGDSGVKFIQLNQNHLIYAAIALTAVLIIALSIKCLYCRPAPKFKRETATTTRASNQSSSVAQSRATSSTTYSSMSSTSVITKVSTNQGIYIPGFLQYQSGIDFRITREIARGGFGLISLGDAFNPKLKEFGDKIIIKQNLKTTLTERDIQLFFQEVSLMAFLSTHKNIAKIVGYSERPYCLLMKLYQYGSLDKWIESSETVKTSLLVFWFLLDISRGVEVMHSKDLAHCDLKPQNVLLDWDPAEQRLFCLLTDFGITQIVTSNNLLVKAFQVVNVRGASMAYAAPEAIWRVKMRQDIPGRDLLMCDIYAIGVIIFELMTRVSAWSC